MEILLPILLSLFIVLWMRGRLKELEEKVAWKDRQIASLTERVFRLEAVAHLVNPPREAAPPPPVLPQPVSSVLHNPQLPPRELLAANVPEALSPPPPKPKRDLESVIGRNWLSKLGVLILLIGIALFLGFSLTEMGPVGRIATGTATSLALLAAGITAERRPAYKVLGGALIGGGWAGLYFTTFAAHGVDAARVIDSPGLGFLLLLLVACAMIVHSLRYRSQTITGIAYLAAFLTIAISSLSQFSALASVPLLVSLLIVAWRFGWHPLVAAGTVFAYTAYAFDLATGDKDRYITAFGEPFLWTYWLLLEAFDLASLRRGSRLPIAPFNLTGFLLATAAVWPSGPGWKPDAMLVTMAVAQLLSALLRYRRDSAGELADTSTFGGFRASITFSSLLAVAFIIQRFDGFERAIALTFHAQAIALFGWLFRNRYLRGLGSILFILPIIGSAANMGAASGQWWQKAFLILALLGLANRLLFLGGRWYSIGAAALLAPVLLDFKPSHFRPVFLTLAAGVLGLLLRWRDKPEARWTGMALAILSLVSLLADIPNALVWVTIGLPAVLYAAFGAALIEGIPRLAAFVIMQFYAGAILYRLVGADPWLFAAWALLAVASWTAGLVRGAPSLAASSILPEWLAITYWLCYWWEKGDGAAARVATIASLFVMYMIPRRQATDGFARIAGDFHAIATAIMTMVAITEYVGGRAITLSWGVEAAVILGLGFLLERRLLRLTGLGVFALCLGKLFFYDFSQLDTLSRIASFIVVGCLLITASWAYTRFRDQLRKYI